MLPRLKNKKTPRVRIIPTPGGSGAFETPDSQDGKGSSTVTWNPTSVDPYGDGVSRDLRRALPRAEPLRRHLPGQGSAGRCGGTGIRTAEVKATLAENRYRTAKGLPPRTEYDGKPLPKNLDECKKPAKKTPPPKGPVKLCEEGANCGGSNGDPHLVTFDRVAYDFQAVGEFTLVTATGNDPLEVQVRQAPMAGTRTASVNSAVAFRVGAHQVALTLTDGGTRVHVDGAPLAAPPERTDLPGGGTLTRRPSDTGPTNGYDVTWPDGSASAVDQIGHYGYRVLVKLADGRAGKVRGLLGDFDGDPTDDIAPSSGTALTQPVPFAQLYPTYADSWRITPDRSLLHYDDGQDTGTFTDRAFPEREVTVGDLDPARRATAEQICRWAGVTAPAQLAECVFDVAVSDRPEFAVAGATTERVAPPATTPITAAPVATASLTPGGAPLTFPAGPGTSLRRRPRRAPGSATAARRTRSPTRPAGRSRAAAPSTASGTSTASTSPPPATTQSGSPPPPATPDEPPSWCTRLATSTARCKRTARRSPRHWNSPAHAPGTGSPGGRVRRLGRGVHEHTDRPVLPTGTARHRRPAAAQRLRDQRRRRDRRHTAARRRDVHRGGRPQRTQHRRDHTAARQRPRPGGDDHRRRAAGRRHRRPTRRGHQLPVPPPTPARR